jgi:hypothetical protein
LKIKSAGGICCSFVVLASLFSSSEARANGRFPGASHLVIRNNEVVITTSFGVVTSSDKLASAGWVCEDALGYSPLQNNELGAAVFPSNAFVISGPLGLTLSTDRGCTNKHLEGAVAGLWMADVSADEKTPTSGIAVSRGAANGSDCNGELFETKDEGKTWNKIGSKLPAGFCALTVDSAPTDSSRVYVSGNVVGADNKLVAQILVSDDRGATWTARDIPNEARPFIGAMDPLDKDTFWVRTSNPPASGTLLVTRDAGKTYTRVAELTGVPLQFFGVTGLAVSPDGQKVAYGSVNEGLFVIEGKNGQPQKRADFPVMCLTWTEDSLYACSAPNKCGPFFVARSTDDGRSFTTLLQTLDIGGDKTTCAAGTPTQQMCPSQWASVRARIQGCEPDAGTDAGSIDAGVDAGGPKDPPPPPIDDCNCDLARINAARPTALVALVLAAVVALARRTVRRR